MCALSVGVGGLCPHRGCRGPHLHGGPPVRSSTPPRSDAPAPHTPPPPTSPPRQPTTDATTTDDAAQKAEVCAFLVLNHNEKAVKCWETRRTSESAPQFHKVFTRQTPTLPLPTAHNRPPSAPPRQPDAPHLALLPSEAPDLHRCPIRATIAKTAFPSRVCAGRVCVTGRPAAPQTPAPLICCYDIC